MSFDYVAIRIVNSFVVVAQTSADRAQGCEDCQSDDERLLHKGCICDIATILQKSAMRNSAFRRRLTFDHRSPRLVAEQKSYSANNAPYVINYERI